MISRRLLSIAKTILLASAATASAQVQIFRAPQAFPAGPNPVAEVAGDFNGDGKTDVAVADNGGVGNLSVLLGNGDGTFQPPVNYNIGDQIGGGPFAMVVGDFNGDGKLDLAVADSTDGVVSILLGNGDGFFQATVNYSVAPNASSSYTPSSITAADFNGDGKLDLAISNAADTVSVLLGNGDGTFQAALNNQTGYYRSTSCGVECFYSYSLESTWVAPGDFNGDGKPDLLLQAGYIAKKCVIDILKGKITCTVLSSAAYLELLLGNGDGTFQNYALQTSGCSAWYSSAMAVADLNGDGKLDAVVSAGGVYVCLGNGDGTFQGPTYYGAGEYNGGDLGQGTLTIGDLNGDGKLDLAVASDPGGVYALLGNGDGTFQPAIGYGAGPSPSAVAIGDLHSDGKADLVVANNLANGAVTALPGNGDGTFGPEAPEFQLGGAFPLSVAAGDFNGDGKLDFVVADASGTNSGSPGISVALGNGDGTFQPADFFAVVQGNPAGVATTDLNGDGKLDLAVADGGTGALVLLGNGDGTFQPPVTYSTPDVGSYPGVAVGDLNGDNKPDLAVTDGNGHVDILLGNGDGTFKTAVSYSSGQTCTGIPVTICMESLAIGDFNGDGKPDLAVPDVAANTVNILLGNGDGTFQAPASYPVGTQPVGTAIADLNGDGKSDLAVANEDGTVSILLGKGDGTVQAAVSYLVASAGAVMVGDFNGDGILDVVAQGSGLASVLLGKGDGTFQQQLVYAFGDNQPASGIAAGDFNGDYTTDLVVGGGLFTFGDTTVGMLLNTAGFYLYIAESGTGAGTVTSSPSGISCGSTCSASFAGGATVTLTATPDSSSAFTGWSGACSGMASPCTVTMKARESVRATFTPVFPLTVAMAGNGGGTVASNPAGINCGRACSASFVSGATVVLSAVPDASSNFSGWSGACSGTGTCSVTMSGAASVTAAFAPQDFSLSPASSALTIQPAGQGTDVITLTGVNGPFGNAIQLTCAITSGPAQPLACALSATSVTPGANSVTSTLTITAPAIAAAMRAPSNHRQGKLPYALLLPLLFGITMVGESRKLRRSYWAVCGVLLLLIFLQTACGGGSSNGTGTPPPTNYRVTITGTSGAIQHTSQVTVTVK